ncbi:MAG: DUF501 domain-containing protein, partial [Phycisphaeraceae bacterium]
MSDEAPSSVWFVSDVDRRCVAEDLGRQPAGRFRVAWRTRTGRPGVIENHPIHVDEKGRPAPFPTTHWLIDPARVAMVSRLEAVGGIAAMEAALADDAAFAARVADDHRRLIAYRLSLLSREEEGQLRDAGRLAALTQRGVAGLADFTRVKCLHAWLAHHLVMGNALGPLLLERLRERDPPDPTNTPSI